MTRRLLRGVLAAALAVSVAGCGGSGAEDDRARSMAGPAAGTAGTAETAPVSPTTAPAAAGGRGPCPVLERAAPVKGGLPDLELPCLGDGPSVNLADLRGVPTVLNVWAAWCTNCDREMPLFADAVARAGDRVRFLGIHYKAPKDFALRSVRDFGVPFPSVHDPDGDLVVQRLGAYAPPQTFFVTADGTVAGREIGEITSQRQLDSLVLRYLQVRL